MARIRRTIDVTTEQALRTWADQKRQMYVGLEGWAARSIIGKLKDEGPGAGSGSGCKGQRWLEMYRADGLVVQRIVVTLSELPRLCLSCYYLLCGSWYRKVSDQAEGIGIDRSEYWSYLRIGEESVSSGLRLLENHSSSPNPVKTGASA